MFLDASALVAVLRREAGWERYAETIALADEVLVSPLSVWETVRGVLKEAVIDVAEVRQDVENYLATIGARLVDISEEEQTVALDAMARYGKGFHPARLNMGDCFAYACARTNKTPLLYKGDDFRQTDVEAV